MKRDLSLTIAAMILLYLAGLWLGEALAGNDGVLRVAAKRDEAVYLR